MRASLALLVGIALVVLGEAFGYVRSAIALAAFVALFLFGFKYWRDVGLIPPEPVTRDVSDQGLRYVCAICGLELKVEVAARDRAPTHCAEPMQLIREDEEVPLRPV